MPRVCTHSALKNAINQSVEALFNNMANRDRMPIFSFTEWFLEIEGILDMHIKKLGNEQVPYAYADGWSDTLSYLHYLQQHFIITPADKAAGNYIFICKKYYFQVMSSELGIVTNGMDLRLIGNHVYKVCERNIADIIYKHIRITSHFGFRIDDNIE